MSNEDLLAKYNNLVVSALNYQNILEFSEWVLQKRKPTNAYDPKCTQWCIHMGAHETLSGEAHLFKWEMTEDEIEQNRQKLSGRGVR